MGFNSGFKGLSNAYTNDIMTCLVKMGSSVSTVGMIVEQEIEKTWMEEAVVQFKAPSWHLSAGKTKRNFSQSGYCPGLKPGSSKYENDNINYSPETQI